MRQISPSDVVVFVPEHGAALRGDENQISGLREIPTPRIVHVPVGVKLVGLPTTAAGGMVTIDAPSSFLALSQLLFNLVADSPFRQGAPPTPSYSENLPQTAMVGDQLFTDIWGGNRCGLYTILVQPMSPREFLPTRVISRPLEKVVMAALRRQGRWRELEELKTLG